MKGRFPIGSSVILTERPDGYLSQHYNVRVNGVYEVIDYMGCCLVTTSDTPDDTVSINASRFQPMSKKRDITLA